MSDDSEFKEAFNWWYFIGIVATLLVFPLLHPLAWIAKMFFF